jgi:hypothetical protein
MTDRMPSTTARIIRLQRTDLGSRPDELAALGLSEEFATSVVGSIAAIATMSCPSGDGTEMSGRMLGVAPDQPAKR